MIIRELQAEGLINPPKWLPDNVVYLTQMGSVAYGVSGGSSDLDIYGFCIPPKMLVFPHLAGEIPGFGRQKKRFDVWQQHHIEYKEKEYDFAVYSIVRYFHLLMENNPNMLDSIFTPRRCVLFSTQLSERVREKRKLFLHKGAYHKLKGYAYAQMKKMGSQDRSNPQRAADIEAHGYDTKFAYHLVRLVNQCRQILVEGDLDLELSREQLKSIRRGEWTLEAVKEYFHTSEKQLDELYGTSKLQHKPPEEEIKTLLMECLESHYGSLSDAVVRNREAEIIRELEELIHRYRA